MIDLTIADGIAALTLRRPPVNAFDDEQLGRFATALAELRERDDVAALLIRTDVRHFSAGADVKALLDALADADPENGVARTTAFAAGMQALWNELAELPLPTIAAIAGAATGGGLELALACDLRIAARGARLGLTEVRLGLLPAAGGTQRLTQLVGRGAAARLMLTGELVDGAEALRLGLVEWLVDDDALDARARELAAAIAQQSKPAMAEIKRCVAQVGAPGGFETEIEATRRLHRTPEARERMRAFAGAGA